MIHYRLHNDPRSSHQQIAALATQLNRGPILDVGSAQGMMGQLLKSTNLPIDAVEPNPQWAEAAKPHYRAVYNGTVESVNLPTKHYQVIICGDVLEHVFDPVDVLKQLRRHATDDATFIISLPNVAHLAVRMMLLCGLFPRMQRGILDKTHLHFFTRGTAIDTLREAGLTVKQVGSTGVPLEEFWPAGPSRFFMGLSGGLQRILIALLPRMFAYQWILVAQQA